MIIGISRGGGGGGGALDPHFGRYVPRRSEKCGALERLRRENGSWSLHGAGASGLEREKCVYTCVKLVVYGAASWPPITQERSLGLAETGRGRRRNGLKIINFENDDLSGAAKTLQWGCSGAEI